jgi:hypothetical protein
MLLKHVKEREEREARRRRGEEEKIEIPKARPIPPRRNSSTSSPSHPPKKRENTLSLSLIEKAKKTTHLSVDPPSRALVPAHAYTGRREVAQVGIRLEADEVRADHAIEDLFAAWVGR